MLQVSSNRAVNHLTCRNNRIPEIWEFLEHNGGCNILSLPLVERTVTMGLIGAIISWIIIGGIIGLIARALMPGKQAMGLGLTIVLGVIGAIVGGFIGGLLGGSGVSGIMSNPWSIGTIVLSVIGALIVMVIYGLATKNRV